MSFRPIELRSHVQAVQTTHKPVQMTDVGWPTTNGQMVVDIRVDPLLDTGGGPLGVSVSFLDVTRSKALQEALEHTNQELETAMEELQSTNEELETTNEELQSTNEELETTNEELQSTNEELETMNEELQSTNEDLETMNEELRDRTSQLDSANAFLETILGNVKAGVVVVDPLTRVRVWNTRCADMWGLREDEVVQQNLFGLDIGLPLERLVEPVQRCLSGEAPGAEMTTDAINRRGRTVQCRITVTPMRGPGGGVQGAIVLIEEEDRS
jgi:two-component system CheB/CheR fusion protein